MRFIDLPVGAKKALVHYSILEAGNDALGDDVLEVENLDDDAWNAILARADKVWRKKHFSLSLLTSEQAAYFVERFSPEVMDEHGGFEKFREANKDFDIPVHQDNSWPVLAMPSCGEALLDGWHRFHSYMNQGFDVYVINMDEIALEANAQFEINNKKAA